MRQRLRAALPLVQRRCAELRQRPARGDRQRGHRRGLELGRAESAEARDVTAALAREQPEKVVAEVTKIREMTLPAHHDVKGADVDPKRLHRILLKTYERQPEDFATLLGMEGVGARTLRALSLVGELVYGAPVSITDPARFSFAHGGKDGHPYPVDKKTYDQSIQTLHTAVEQAKIGQREQMDALKRLTLWAETA